MSGLAFLRERGMGASILVAALSSAFGVVLLTASGYVAAVLQRDEYVGQSRSLEIVIGVLSWLLVLVAVYVAAIVTSNTFATIVAGRTPQIALMRLIGDTARSQRTKVTTQGLVVGVIGAVLGLGAGLVLAAVGPGLLDQWLDVNADDWGGSIWVVLPAIVVALTTWAAAWAGSRGVLSVTPLQALGRTVDGPLGPGAGRIIRNVLAVLGILVGGVLLAGGIVVGLSDERGVVIAFAGGLVSFTGLVLGSTMIMPPVLWLVGRCFGTSTTARLAAENALRYRDRSSRMAIGVVIGVTLVTMFAVAAECTKAVLTANSGGELAPELADLVDTFANVMMAVVAVSAVIAAVGLVNLLTIGVVQRRRELGLLRALGLTRGQIRAVVLLEAAHIIIAGVGLGLVLGIGYGWAGAQSMLGWVPTTVDGEGGNFVMPAVPIVTILIVAAIAAVITLIAAVTPTRLATRVTPVTALSTD